MTLNQFISVFQPIMHCAQEIIQLKFANHHFRYEVCQKMLKCHTSDPDVSWCPAIDKLLVIIPLMRFCLPHRPIFIWTCWNLKLIVRKTKCFGKVKLAKTGLHINLPTGRSWVAKALLPCKLCFKRAMDTHDGACPTMKGSRSANQGQPIGTIYSLYSQILSTKTYI